METYAGIDLHSSNNFIGVINDEDKRLYGKRHSNCLEDVLRALNPFKQSLKGVVVESTFNWYWLVDGLQENGYIVHLANPSAMKQYEGLKHTGGLPIIGVNTFRDPEANEDQWNDGLELARATEAEKQSQLKRLAAFKKRHQDQSASALERLQQVALSGGNVFAELMHTVRYCSLGQITRALYDVGGKYRRNM